LSHHSDFNKKLKSLHDGDVKDMSSMQWICRNYTVVFADVRSFTKLFELHGAEETAMILGDYFILAWEERIKSHEGSIDKFIGDAIMILFQDAKGAFWACCSLLDLANKVDEHLNRNPPKGWLGMEFSIGIGIETGEIMESEIEIDGKKHILRYGEAINVASRLAEIAEPWEILIGEGAYEQLKEVIDPELLAKIRRERKKPGEYVCWKLDTVDILGRD